jgi:hypothetical protein
MVKSQGSSRWLSAGFVVPGWREMRSNPTTEGECRGWGVSERLGGTERSFDMALRVCSEQAGSFTNRGYCSRTNFLVSLKSPASIRQK